MDKSFFNKALEYGDILFHFTFKYFSGVIYFFAFGIVLAVFCWCHCRTDYASTLREMLITSSPQKAIILRTNFKARFPSFCDDYYVKNPSIFALKLKEDNRKLGIWAFNLFQTPLGEMVAVRKINDGFQGIYTCGKVAYGNLDRKTVREARLLEKTGTLDYHFQSDSMEEIRYKQISEEAYKHF